jgi:hypothetical protein
MCKNWNTPEEKAVVSTEATDFAAPTTTIVEPPVPQYSKANAAIKGHPTSFEAFYAKYPSFLWGPLVVAGLLYGACHHVPVIVHYLAQHNYQAFGWTSAWQYTAFAIVSSYAFHGFCTTHAPHKLKIQADKQYQVKPDAMAIRSTAALMTELIYTFLPLAPSTHVWWKFAAWTAALAIYWDAHFYAAHRYVHENKAAYRFFHKTHHLCKEPNCFGAYFVTYQSHILMEQLVVLILAAAGLPRNVFVFSLYWGTIGTYVEHSGFELGSMKLPLLPITFGQFSQGMGFATSWCFDGKYNETAVLEGCYLQKRNIYGTIY